MGVDFLDLSLEIQKLFGIRLEPADILPIWKAHGNDCTVGDMHDIIVANCQTAGVTVPRSSWNRVRVALVRALGVRVKEVRRDAWLRRDLQFY
jgi:hypothetical protein